MIKKGLVLAALMSSLPLCAGVKLETTLKLVDKEIVKELSLTEEDSAKIAIDGAEFAFNIVEAQEDAVVLNLVVSNVEENGAVVEHASRSITAQWEKSTEVLCDGADITLSIVPSKIA